MARYLKEEKTGVGPRVRAQREKMGWSQEELAQKLHIERNTLGMKEGGKRAFTPDELLRLSDIFGITVDEMLTGIKTKSWNTKRDLGLNDESINAFRQYRKHASEEKMESLNRALSNCATLEAIAAYSMKEPTEFPHGYYLSSNTKKDPFFVDCTMSHDLFHAVLGQQLLHVIDKVINGTEDYPFSAAEDFRSIPLDQEGDDQDDEKK